MRRLMGFKHRVGEGEVERARDLVMASVRDLKRPTYYFIYQVKLHDLTFNPPQFTMSHNFPNRIRERWG